MVRRTLTLCLALALLEAGAADFVLAADRFSFRISPTYFSGDYGTGIETTLTFVPFDFRWDYSRARLKVIVPYVSISDAGRVTFTGAGPGPSVQSPAASSSDPSPMDPPGSGGVPAGPSGTPPAPAPAPPAGGGPPAPPPGFIRSENVGTSQSGLGDVRLAADLYLLKGSATRPWITLGPFFKLATADESKGLGTGENDYGAGLGLTAPLGGGWQAYADAGYQVTGDPPGIDYRNVRKVGLGLGKTLKDRITWEGYYEDRNSLLDGVANLRDASVGLRIDAAAGTTLGFTLFKGLSGSAEDWGLGLSLGR